MSASATPLPHEAFAAKLREAQAAAGIKNEDLASEVGVSVRLLQVWRSGKGAPGAANLAALTVVLERDAAWFFSQPESREAA